MRIAGLIIVLALVLAWSLCLAALLMGHNGIIAGAGIAGLVSLGEISRLIIKTKKPGSKEGEK